MASPSPQVTITPAAEKKLQALQDQVSLQKIQNLFSEILRADLALVNLQGTFLTPVTTENLSFARLFPNQHVFKQAMQLSFQKGIKKFLEAQQEVGSCYFGSKILLIPITAGSTELLGFVVAGPFYLGSQKPSKTDVDWEAASLGVDVEGAAENLRLIPVFSYKTLENIRDLIKEVISFYLAIESQKAALESSLPGYLDFLAKAQASADTATKDKRESRA